RRSPPSTPFPYTTLFRSYGLVASDLPLGLFFILSVSSIEVVGVIMAGWASNSKWSILGTMREVAQVISYEMPLAISALTVVVLADRKSTRLNSSHVSISY